MRSSPDSQVPGRRVRLGLLPRGAQKTDRRLGPACRGSSVCPCQRSSTSHRQRLRRTPSYAGLGRRERADLAETLTQRQLGTPCTGSLPVLRFSPATKPFFGASV